MINTVIYFRLHDFQQEVCYGFSVSGLACSQSFFSVSRDSFSSTCFTTSTPYQCVGLRFRGSLLFAGVHSIVAFIAFFFSSVFSLGFSTFLGLDVFSGSAFFFSSASFFSAGVSSFSFILAVLSSSSVVTFSVFDVIVVSSSSSLSGRMYVSSSLVSSSVGHSGLSLCLDVPAFSFSAVSFATSLFGRITSFLLFFGRKVIVCSVSFITFPAFLLYWPSSFDPFVLSRTKIVESISSFGSVSETFLIRSTTLLFTVFGCRPYSFSNSDFPSAFWPVRNAYKISDKPDFSRFRTMLLFVLKRSLMVRTIFRFFHFLDGHVPGRLCV